jgi:hypothetical protein
MLPENMKAVWARACRGALSIKSTSSVAYSDFLKSTHTVTLSLQEWASFSLMELVKTPGCLGLQVDPDEVMVLAFADSSGRLSLPCS